MEHDQQQAPPREDQGGKGSGLGGLWLLLAPLACCGGPLLVAGLAAAGVLAWGGLGLAVAALLAGAVLVIRRRRRRACHVPDEAGSWREAGTMTPGSPAR